MKKIKNSEYCVKDESGNDVEFASYIPEDKPKPGVQYALTGGSGTKCIMNGNSWSESEIKKE